MSTIVLERCNLRSEPSAPAPPSFKFSPAFQLCVLNACLAQYCVFARLDGDITWLGGLRLSGSETSEAQCRPNQLMRLMTRPTGLSFAVEELLQPPSLTIWERGGRKRSSSS
eukprot:477586-Rhodomonas_salina.1